MAVHFANIFMARVETDLKPKRIFKKKPLIGSDI